MAVERSYARLGFFIVVGLVVVLATALLFIQRMRSREVLELVTYVRENVSGLDVSSPVRFRGVPLGRVSGIRVDPGGNTIEVSFEVFRDRLVSIGADVANIEQLATQTVFPRMRAQVIGNPVTGEAYLLLDTQRRGHIGHALLHQRPDGEVVEDPAWRWSAAPDRYLDTALRYELSSAPGLRPVDSGPAQAVAVTLLSWHLESAGASRLVGAVQLDVTGTDRAIRTQVIRASEAVSAELPGDLAAAAGRLLHRLASDVAARIPGPGR